MIPQSHLTILHKSVSLYASRPAFKLPQTDKTTGRVDHWNDITYQQFHDHVESAAAHWLKTFSTANIPSKSVIGLWLSGWAYSDTVHIYALSRAGYVPQPFRMTLSNHEVIFELLGRANARALIYEASLDITPDTSPVPIYKTPDIDRLDTENEGLPEFEPVVNGDDVALIFHTSGSTSNIPKLVPCSYTWLDGQVRKLEQTPGDPNRATIGTWMGSTCHLSHTIVLLSYLKYGSCALQPSTPAFSSEELVDMIEQCGLDTLKLFASFLGSHFKNACFNPKLLALLQSLDLISYAGMSLTNEEERWAHESGLPLHNRVGITECGVVMQSFGKWHNNHTLLLRPVNGTSYRFLPVDPASLSTSSEATGLISELIVLSDSPDCPHVSLRSPRDGHFHTGDLFEEVTPGCYIFRGRNDDWIKMENAGRCDAKSIEDNMRSTCSDLIADCVIVGNRRPSPALFVEPVKDNIDSGQLKEEIFKRTRKFHEQRYAHERIMSIDLIIVVNRGSLPRTHTKGNIRRSVVEEAFKEQLDEIYKRT